jgi:pSer/pThr/pTyr-binding forkhead associated (FHA) protein
MVETLLLWFNRFTDDPAKVRARLAGRPVLVYEPPTEDTLDPNSDEDDDYQLRTQSGLSVPAIGGGDPMAVVIEKTKDNAFKQRITIGRTANNDIVLDDTSVSRFHAWIEQQNSDWVLVDAGSRNGSTLGGKKIAAKAPNQLTNGLVMRIGALQLTYYTAQGFLDMLHRRATE